MNKMTKDELIIYFIEHLGDNHVLGPIMSIEQIRDKLQYLIKDVTYENAPEKAGIACWKPKEGILYFNLGNIEPKKELFIIMHELIHVLATTIETQEVTEPDQSGVRLETRIKSGISYQKYRDNEYVKDSIKNKVVNEGATNAIVKKILGAHFEDNRTERNSYNIISIIVGEDAIIKQYFNEEISEDEFPAQMFIEDTTKRYGSELGEKLYDGIRKVLTLWDQSFFIKKIATREERKKYGQDILKEIDKELDNTIQNMITALIENEPDVMKKINNILIPLFDTDFGKKFSEPILGELINSQEMEQDEKIAVLKQIKQVKNSYIPPAVIDGLSKDKNLEEKVDSYLDLCTEEDKWDSIYDLYVKEGLIYEDRLPKKNIFRRIINFNLNGIPKDSNDILDLINDASYRQMGDYFELIGRGSNMLFDREGEPVNSDAIIGNFGHPMYGEIEDFYQTTSCYVDYTNIENLKIALQKKYAQFIGRMGEKQPNTFNMSVSLEGNIIRLTFYENNRYKDELLQIKEDGSIEQIEPRSRKKIYR